MLKAPSILLVFLVPASLIVLTRVCPAKIHPASGEADVDEAEVRRIEAEERRAEREKARKERRAVKRAKENEQQSLDASDQWFAENDEMFGISEAGERRGFERSSVPRMMPLPMPPARPDMAYGRMRGGRGLEEEDEFVDFGFFPDAWGDGYSENGYGDDSGNGFGRF